MLDEVLVACSMESTVGVCSEDKVLSMERVDDMVDGWKDKLVIRGSLSSLNLRCK